jgi:hypothetical protein
MILKGSHIDVTISDYKLSKQVDGHSNQNFKGFQTQQGAIDFMNSGGGEWAGGSYPSKASASNKNQNSQNSNQKG